MLPVRRSVTVDRLWPNSVGRTSAYCYAVGREPSLSKDLQAPVVFVTLGDPKMGVSVRHPMLRETSVGEAEMRLLAFAALGMLAACSPRWRTQSFAAHRQRRPLPEMYRCRSPPPPPSACFSGRMSSFRQVALTQERGPATLGTALALRLAAGIGGRSSMTNRS